MDDVIVAAVLLGVPLGYLALQLRALRRWQGRGRLAAGLPLLGWAMWGLILARDVLRDPSSHNLFPFEILLGALAALAYLGLVAGLRRLLRA
jgi:hypothetical protein